MKGKGLKPAKGQNPNSFYEIPAQKPPLINDKEQLPKPEIKKVYEYGITTKKGDVIEVKGK